MATPRPRADIVALGERPEGSLYAWFYGQLRSAILEGRLPAGSRLPSTRSMAETYQVARGTVVEAFEQLQAEGYVTGKAGSGTFVAPSLPDEWFAATRPWYAPQRTGAGRPALSKRGLRLGSRDDFEIAGRPRVFQPHRPAVDEAALAAWRRLSGRARVRHPAFSWHNDPLGYRPLRVAVADHLGRVRGMRCSPEQVVITSGVLQTLDLCVRLLTDSGDAVLLEDPGYNHARRLFEVNELRVLPLPIDGEGADIDAAELGAASPRLVYVTPAHQFPLGMTLGVRRRLALLSWAARTGAWIFEDDYDSEYRFGGRPISALQSLDEHGCVIYAATFSKVIFQPLRLGYVVVPENLIETFAAARANIDRYPPLESQMILCDFIAEGHFARHLRRMRELYAERMSTLVGLVSDRLGDELEIAPVKVGLQTTAWIRSGRDDRELARAASAHGVEVVPLSCFRLQRPLRSGLLVGFAAYDAAAMRRGIEGLERAFYDRKSAQSRLRG